MSAFEAGDRLAGYELLELVGEGPTGQVFRALQPRLERVVAVKIVRSELVDDGFRERFRREMAIATSVEHPGIVPVYEVGEDDGVLFVAMRWVEGPDLGRLIAERGRLHPTQAVRILRRVADALEAAHGAGLFHRALKPSNILLEGDRVYLTDFPGDNPADPGAEVEGLARVLYEMLTGLVPSPPAEPANGPRAAASGDPVPASELRDGLPTAIDPVLRRGLSADPAERYGTPAELLDAVEGAFAGSTVDGAPSRPRRRRRLAALGSVALLAIAAVVVILLATGNDGDDGNASAAAEPIGGRALPAPATLDPCAATKTFAGPPRQCRSKTGGVELITDIRRPLRLATMNFTVTRVRAAPRLLGSDGSIFSAPKGIRFIVIDATITNLTSSEQVFEPDNLTVRGRDTALWFFDDRGKIVPYHSREGDDYSVQYNTVVGSLQTPLAGVKLIPHIPYSGQLVFHYPATTVDANRRALLEVHELGHGFAYAKSLGGVRLHL